MHIEPIDVHLWVAAMVYAFIITFALFTLEWAVVRLCDDKYRAQLKLKIRRKIRKMLISYINK